MNFRLDPKSPPSAEFHRVVLEELDLAIAKLREGDIHKTRSAIKRIRALLLLTDASDKDATAKAGGVVLRDAAGSISEIRDIQVCLSTLHEMESSEEAPSVSFFSRARQAVSVIQHPAAADSAVALQKLEEARNILAGWLPEPDIDSIVHGLHDSYRKSRRAGQRVKISKPGCNYGSAHLRNSEVMHLLRKRLNRLWAQVRLFRAFLPRKIKASSKELEKITDLLGREHDLVILRQRIEFPEIDPELAPLSRTIDKHRAGLDRDAILLVGRFFKKEKHRFADIRTSR